MTEGLGLRPVLLAATAAWMLDLRVVNRLAPILAIALAAVVLAACPQAPEAPASPPASPPAAPASPEAAATHPQAVTEALDAIRDRQRCNRIMGCDPAVTLAQHGRAAVPAILEALGDSPQGSYWVVRLISLLGQLDDERALPFLHGMLADNRWELRCEAAVALGRLKRQASHEALQAAYGRARADKDLPFEAALLLALDRMNGTVDGGAPREVLAARLPTDREILGPMNPGFFRFLVDVVRFSRLPSGLPMVRLGAVHRDRFVRLSSLATLGALQDTGGIPYAVGRLDDPLPSVKRAALGALQEITGSRSLTEPEQWKAWCEARSCRAALEKAAVDSP